MARDHLHADPLQHLRCEGSGRAVAGGADHAQAARHAEVADKIVEVGLAHPLHPPVAAPVAGDALAAQHDVAQPHHVLGAVGERALEAHLDPGPAVWVWLAVTIATAGASRWNCAK
jgi:hypothetical protein